MPRKVLQPLFPPVASMLAMLIGMTSCSLFNSSSDEEEIFPYNPKTSRSFSDIAADHLRYSVDGGSANAAKHEIQGVTLEDMKKRAEANDWIVTDPDDLEKSIASLESASQIKYGVGWETTYEKAREEASRSQRPLLMWFADSRRSPNSMQLGAELIDTEDFNKWAADNVIRLKLDSYITGYDSKGETRRKDYLKKISKQFNVNGTPQLFILTPDGQTVDQIRGYVSGTHESILRKIKNSTEIACSRYKETKKQLVGKGFRDWEGSNGMKIFARLYRYSPDGRIILQEPDSRFLRTTLKSLSAQDRDWINQEKAKRGL